MGGIPRLLEQLRRRRAARVAGAALCGALACAGPPPEPDARALARVSDGRPLMGTILEITLVADDPARARALIERCFAEGERLESIFTTWREDGELARLNARAGRGPQPASPELVRILLDARRFARRTGGVFDVTVGPLIGLWRDAEKRGAPPSPAEIAAARAHVGSERFVADASGGTIALEAGASVDLGGFAKGWTLDRLGELLRDAGVERGLLNFGGSSLLALGPPLDSAFWRVAVDGGPVLALRGTSASISSAYGQAFEVAGVKFAHIVDPRSGWPVQSRQRAIVVAPDGATAEAWSKAVVVLPSNESIPSIERQSGISARVDDPSGTRVESQGFDRWVSGGDRE